MRRTTTILSAICILLVLSQGCNCRKPQPPVDETPDMGGFPDAVGKILVSKCATAGCHNAASAANSANLRLDTWSALFEGGSSGAEVIPYSPDFSPLLYFVNTDPARGVVATPTMPYDATGNNASPLSETEYNTLKEWITNGAPDKDGNVAFSSNPDTRQKIYLTQQGCDLVAVIDAATGLVMRYIKVGVSPGTESPHSLRTSADGHFAYVSFLNGTGIQKIDTRTDAVVQTATLGAGSWNILYIAPGDSIVATTDWTSNGRILYAKASTMTNIPEYTGSGAGLFVYPHGIASDLTFDTAFITAQYGNVVYRWAPKIPHYRKVSINGLPPNATNAGDKTSPNPHEILMVPDHSRYFLTCEGTNDVRIMDAHTDQLLKVIPVGKTPQELALSRTKPYMFVTCMEDEEGLGPRQRGSVYVINYNTYEIVKIIKGDFFQPHGITVDDINGRIYVASTNANPDGPAPHHATACAGRAGWYNIYDLNTLESVNRRSYQVAVMPYSADVRFKP